MLEFSGLGGKEKEEKQELTNIWGSDHQYHKVPENQGAPLPSSKGK